MHAQLADRPLWPWCPPLPVLPLLSLLLLPPPRPPVCAAATSRRPALATVPASCEDPLRSFCGEQQGDVEACSMCAGIHQSQLRHGGCTHQMIMEFCKEPQPVRMLGFKCTCGPKCLPLQQHEKKSGHDVVVQINEDDAGRFDPLEEGRVDWNATTILVRRIARRPVMCGPCPPCRLS